MQSNKKGNVTVHNLILIQRSLYSHDNNVNGLLFS